MRALVLVGLILSLPSAAATATLSVAVYAFEPARLEVDPGETVRLTNADSEPHLLRTRDGLLTFGEVPAMGNATFIAPDSPGDYPYYCPYHTSADDPGPFMKGSLVVRAPAASDQAPPASPSAIAAPWAVLALVAGAAVALVRRRVGRG